VRRGLANVSIQVYLTAMAMNLKRLAAFLLLFFANWINKYRSKSNLNLSESCRGSILYQWQKIYLTWNIAPKKRNFCPFFNSPTVTYCLCLHSCFLSEKGGSAFGGQPNRCFFSTPVFFLTNGIAMF
jgi:hypothetical protein